MSQNVAGSKGTAAEAYRPGVKTAAATSGEGGGEEGRGEEVERKHGTCNDIVR